MSSTLGKYAQSHRVPREFLHQMGKRFRWRADFADRPVFLALPDLEDQGGLRSGPAA